MATHNHQVRRFMMLNKKDDKPWLCFTAQQANSTIRLDKVGTPNAVSLETSRDGKVWTPYSWTDNTGDTITLTKVSEKVYWRNIVEDDSGVFSSTNENYYNFILVGLIAASGNIQSLLKKDCNRLSVHSYCYCSLFANCKALTKAPMLPAIYLALRCYQMMFNYCTSLVVAPKLPALTLSSTCYYSMFNRCTALLEAPELPATSLANTCYQQMFANCESLRTAPELPATIGYLNCYRRMFENCNFLPSVKMMLQTLTVSSCIEMFGYSKRFSSLKVSFTDWPEGGTSNWLQNVSDTGTFYCPDELDDSIRDASHIPVGWTVIKQGYFHDGVLYRDAEFTTPSNISSTTAVYEDILTGNRYSSDGTSLTLISN